MFGFHETLEVVTDGVPALAADATEAHKKAHNEVKKKDCKAAYWLIILFDIIKVLIYKNKLGVWGVIEEIGYTPLLLERIHISHFSSFSSIPTP